MTIATRRTNGGFTLVEMVVVLAIPSYVGTRRNALLPEAGNALSELKTMGWAYYLQYGTWDGITDANMTTLFGFHAPHPAGSCWNYGLEAPAVAAEIR